MENVAEEQGNRTVQNVQMNTGHCAFASCLFRLPINTLDSCVYDVTLFILYSDSPYMYECLENQDSYRVNAYIHSSAIESCPFEIHACNQDIICTIACCVSVRPNTAKTKMN